MTIAVTGPFASGKSTFVRMLGDLGAETVSSDEIVHDLLSTDEGAISAIVGRFGEEVRGERGIDRRLLAKQVFGDAGALRDLEDILHPLVRRETGLRIENSGSEIFVAEIPLLFEGGRSDAFDYTVAVTVPEERRREWAGERGVGEEQLQAIEERQLSGEEKAGRADFVVENDGGLERLEDQARDLRDRALGERSPDGGIRTQET